MGPECQSTLRRTRQLLDLEEEKMHQQNIGKDREHDINAAYHSFPNDRRHAKDKNYPPLNPSHIKCSSCSPRACGPAFIEDLRPRLWFGESRVRFCEDSGWRKGGHGICVFRIEHYCRFGPVDISTRATSKNMSVMSKTAKVARERVERMAERLAEEVEPTR